MVGFIFYFILIMALPLLVQIYLKKTYSSYSKIPANSGMTGAEVARKILDQNGLYNVRVEPISGTLTDHYDPRDKVVRLSSENYYGTSISALSVSAHECGHSIQDQQSFLPLRIRHALVPVASFGSNVSFILIMIGILLSSTNMLLLGIIAMAAAVLFQVITLPVEFDASARARNVLASSGFINNSEEDGVRKVLNAAALTYVASTLVALAELLRFVLMFFNINSSDED